jgi:PAS domain S-box-containing protein
MHWKVASVLEARLIHVMNFLPHFYYAPDASIMCRDIGLVFWIHRLFMFRSQVCFMFADEDRAGSGVTNGERSDCTGVADERAEIQAIQAAVAANKRVEESALLSAINMCQNGIIVGDLWGYITHVNEVIVKMYGASDKSEFVGKHVLNFLAQEDRERAVNKSLNSITTNQGRTEAYRVLSKSGEDLLLEVTVDFIRDEQGEKIGFVDVVRDISGRRTGKS